MVWMLVKETANVIVGMLLGRALILALPLAAAGAFVFGPKVLVRLGVGQKTTAVIVFAFVIIGSVAGLGAFAKYVIDWG